MTVYRLPPICDSVEFYCTSIVHVPKNQTVEILPRDPSRKYFCICNLSYFELINLTIGDTLYVVDQAGHFDGWEDCAYKPVLARGVDGGVHISIIEGFLENPDGTQRDRSC